jgi:hypothetical protein
MGDAKRRAKLDPNRGSGFGKNAKRFSVLSIKYEPPFHVCLINDNQTQIQFEVGLHYFVSGDGIASELWPFDYGDKESEVANIIRSNLADICAIVRKESNSSKLQIFLDLGGSLVQRNPN